MRRTTTATTTRPTTTDLIRHVEASIGRAERGESKLDRAAFRPRGFTSAKVRHLLNNLGSLEGLDYLEVGVHRGATFLATNYENELSSAVAVDNWSEFDEDGGAKAEFLEHCATQGFIRRDDWDLLIVEHAPALLFERLQLHAAAIERTHPTQADTDRA